MAIDIKNVAKNSRNVVKMKKNEGFYNINQLIDAYNNHDDNAAEAALVALYSFFSESVKKMKEYNPFQWTAMAIGQKDIRSFLNYVYSDGSNLIGTDGCRMHVVPYMDYPAGYYDSNMVKIDKTDQYPDWEKVMVDTAAAGVMFYPNINLREMPIINKGQNFEVYELPDGLLVNCKYLDQAVQMLDDKNVIDYYVEFSGTNGDEPYKMLLVGNDGQRAVIMPVKK
jgi:hypothetical protein